MITKGEVQKDFDYATNKVSVRIPLFETAGDTTPFIVDCAICEAPGSTNYYRAGDIVWIGFERDEISNPVVIGKLNTKNSNLLSTNSTLSSDSLIVTSSASLPTSTTVGNTDLGQIITSVNHLLENQQIKLTTNSMNTAIREYANYGIQNVYGLTKGPVIVWYLNFTDNTFDFNKALLDGDIQVTIQKWYKGWHTSSYGYIGREIASRGDDISKGAIDVNNGNNVWAFFNETFASERQKNADTVLYINLPYLVYNLTSEDDKTESIPYTTKTSSTGESETIYKYKLLTLTSNTTKIPKFTGKVNKYGTQGHYAKIKLRFFITYKGQRISDYSNVVIIRETAFTYESSDKSKTYSFSVM